MESWSTCRGCGLRHSTRTDRICPRCRQPLEGVLAPEARPDVPLRSTMEGATASVPTLPAVLRPALAVMRGRRRWFLVAGLLVACTGLVALSGAFRGKPATPPPPLDFQVVGGPLSIMGDRSNEWTLAVHTGIWWQARYFIHPMQLGAFWLKEDAHLLVFSGRRPDEVAIDVEEATETVIKKAKAADPTFQVLERIPASVRTGTGVALHASLSEGGVERECWCVVVAAGPRVAVILAMTARERFSTLSPYLLEVASQFRFVSK